MLLFGHFRIAYLYNKQNTVDMPGVFHAALDIDNYLPQSLLSVKSHFLTSDFLNSSEYTMALFVKTHRLNKEGTDCQIAPEYSV